MIKAALKSVKKLCPSSKKKRLPITIWLLRPMVSLLLASTRFFDRVIAAMMVVAFFGLLRAGEICSRKGFYEGLLWSQVYFDPDGEYVKIHLPSSKGDIFREGCTITLWRIGGHFCPVAHMMFLHSLRSNSGFESVFVFPTATGSAVYY